MCLLQILRDNLMRSCHFVLLKCQSSYEIASNGTHFLKNSTQEPFEHDALKLLIVTLNTLRLMWIFQLSIFVECVFSMQTEISSKQTFSPRKFYKSIQLWHMQILNLSKRTLSPKAGINWVHVFFFGFLYLFRFCLFKAYRWSCFSLFVEKKSFITKTIQNTCEKLEEVLGSMAGNKPLNFFPYHFFTLFKCESQQVFYHFVSQSL